MQLLRTRLLPSFVVSLKRVDMDVLEEDATPICGVTPDLRIAYTNPAWVRFGEENAGPARSERWLIGVSIVDAIQGPVRTVYEKRYARATRDGEPWEHVYECPSPTMHRIFRLHLLPLPGGGALAIHDLVEQHPIEAGALAEPFEERNYVDGHGLVVQCGHCRRVRRVGSIEWDFVARFLSAPSPQTSHGICPRCAGLYYPELRLGS